MYFHKLIAMFFLAFSINAQAALFGASNFEECMNDGKVGRTSAELNVLMNKCSKQFPKLQKMSKGKNATINCVSNNQKNLIELVVIGSYINSNQVKLKIAMRDSDELHFFGDVPNSTSSEFYGKINFLNGTMILNARNKISNAQESYDSFACVEK